MQRKTDSQVTIAYGAIRDQILQYLLPPGAPLSDNQLSKALGMSRAPIREAILLLQMDGLVQVDEGGKVRVSPICFEDISDILSVRCALESEAIRLIANAGWLDAQQEQELIDLHRQLCESTCTNDVTEQYGYDDLFHLKIAEFSKSKRICEILGQMRLQMQRARWLNFANPKRQESASQEHQVLLAAILNHDAETAINHLRIHFDNSRNSFYVVLNDKKMQPIYAAISNFSRQNQEKA